MRSFRFSRHAFTKANLNPLKLRPTLTPQFSIRPLSVSSSLPKQNTDLLAKLTEELSYEKEQMPKDATDFLQEFSKSSHFTIADVNGQKQVELHRTFKNEKITVFFDVGSIQDQEAYDEEDNEETASHPIPVVALIEKPTGTMEIKATIEGDAFFIDSIAVSGDSKTMAGPSAEDEWSRGKIYYPVFADLDEALQNQFTDYFSERGFNSELAEFINDYVHLKEQKEYIAWLENVKNFIKA